MNKLEIIDDIYKIKSIQKKDVKFIINFFLKKIKETTEAEKEVQIRGFGTFYKSTKKPRKIYSPIAKKIIEVPAKSKLCFRASKVTKKLV